MKSKITTKIIVSILLAFVLVVTITNNIFLGNTPKVNTLFIKKLFTKKPTPTPTIRITPPAATLTINPTIPVQTVTLKIKPIISPAISKTVSKPTSTPIPSPTKTVATPKPTAPAGNSGCPSTSSQTYSSIRQNPNIRNKINFDLSKNAETNLYMRGWTEINEGKELISRNGDNYGLDPNMPPQISTLFPTHYPKISKTYIINAWDYENNHNLPGQSATPAYRVHMLGLEAAPGEALVGLKAGRTIDGTNVFLVLYATKNYILMIHANEDSWDEYGPPGYPFYFIDICVDPNLVSLYEKNQNEGRNELPGIATGQVFGYAKDNEVKFVIRDTMSFMDSRYKEDWWEYGN